MKFTPLKHLSLFAMFFACSMAAQEQRWTSYRPDTLGFSTDVRLTEISGLISSKRNPNRFWVHNDSGDAPKIYALSASMEVEQAFLLKGAKHIDWEDMADGHYKDTSYLFIGDIGDNAAKRNSITIYLVEEPALNASSELLEIEQSSIELQYPDGPRDAEALLYDPSSEELIVITKRDEKARVYAIALNVVNQTHPTTLEFVGTLRIEPLSNDLAPMRRYLHYITAADQYQNKRVIIKNYFRAWLYENPQLKPLKKVLVDDVPLQIPYMLEQQGEAMAFDLDGLGYYTTSECADDGTKHVPQPLIYYRPN